MDWERPCTTTSAAEIAHNGDVLMEVFLYVPAKSLIRFKSVCKHWHSLISDAYFSYLHTRRHRQAQTSFLLRTSPSQFFYFNPTTKKLVPFHAKFAEAKIRQSRHGLLLLECGYPHKDYYVYNPTTGESRNLLIKNGQFLELHLAFDPSKLPYYKVVCLRTACYSIDHFLIELYDSKTRAWKLDDKARRTPPLPLRYGTYWQNCIYWKTFDGGVLCFDIEKFVFRMPPLEIFSIRDQIGQVDMFELVESGGLVYYKDVISCLSLFEITEKGGDWSLKCTVDFDHITGSFGAIPRAGICLMGAITGEREEESSLVFHVPGKIMAYRFYDEMFEELVDLRAQKFYREDRLQFGYHEAFQFIESLALV